MPIEFTHMITGKKIMVRSKEDVMAIIHGTTKTLNMPNEVAAVFIIIDKVPSPIPVAESYEDVKTILGL